MIGLGLQLASVSRYSCCGVVSLRSGWNVEAGLLSAVTIVT